jgi:outer membrane receptor protein involved in Fe transport
VGAAGNSTNSAGAGLEGTVDIKSGRPHSADPETCGQGLGRLPVRRRTVAGRGPDRRGGIPTRGATKTISHQADGVYYLGSGKSSGYTVTNLTANYKLNRQIQFFGQINNLFDPGIHTAAQLGSTAFSNSGDSSHDPFRPWAANIPSWNSTFLAPGAPRTLWVGIRYSL